MSTPHKLNVTFWDMADKPPNNNGYATKIADNNNKSQKRAYLSKHRLALCAAAVFCALTCALDVTMFTSVTLPFLAVAGVHFWHSVTRGGLLSHELSHAIFCASVLGEVLGGTVVQQAGGFAGRTAVHMFVLILTGALLGGRCCEPTLLMYAGTRLFLWSCLPWFPEALRAVLTYASALGGAIAARYVEGVFVSKIAAEVKLATTPRRRRTSNNALYSVYKMRRTSLPALGGSNKSVHQAFGFQIKNLDIPMLMDY